MGMDEKKHKITVIDDEKALVGTIKKFLEDRNFEVSFAYGGFGGLNVIHEEKPDLILLDMVMHDMDGRDLIIAFFQEVPPAFKDMMKRLFQGLNIDYSQFEDESTNTEGKA